jgi:hypothetical protein
MVAPQLWEQTEAGATKNNLPKIDEITILWDYPIMKLVADERSRIASTVLFKPRAVYDAERHPDGTIVLIELVPAEVPTVKPRRLNGRLHGADISLDAKTIAAAVQADRDSR